MHASDVVVLGGGIIGLGIAWELALRGADVTVLERAAPAHAASWAAAGMLAPQTEDIEDPVLLAFARQSLAQYPSFAQRLHAASGVDIRLRLHGILEAAYDEAGAANLKARTLRQQSQGMRVETIAHGSATLYEPALARDVLYASINHDEGQVDNRRLGRALFEAARAAGVRLRTDCPLASVECNARRVLGVQLADGFLAAGTVINALGAWAGDIPGIPAAAVVPVFPVKGQIIALAMPQRYVRHVVWGGGVYLVPRDDGRLLVGATVERSGFDERVTAGGVAHLLNGVCRVLPGAATFALSETWAGLRPQTPDGQPILGPTELEGYWLATGHYRNGVLLTPATASAVADAVCGKAEIDAAFHLARPSLRGAAYANSRTA